ncbi:hypothetical protein AM10699_30670 [Acaryochloris marina MBIC10699]|nr:hypothetical protein AM10699_30670 [Acaryochloris marina MBIC10699]
MRSHFGIMLNDLILYRHLTNGKYGNGKALPNTTLVQSRQIETSVPAGDASQKLWIVFGTDCGWKR